MASKKGLSDGARPEKGSGAKPQPKGPGGDGLTRGAQPKRPAGSKLNPAKK